MVSLRCKASLEQGGRLVRLVLFVLPITSFGEEGHGHDKGHLTFNPLQIFWIKDNLTIPPPLPQTFQNHTP
eukprot:1805441-Amphidinium_carterae.1